MKCIYCKERDVLPGWPEARICSVCYLAELNELQPLTEEELAVLELDFFGEERQPLGFDENSRRWQRIEELRIDVGGRLLTAVKTGDHE